MIQPAALADRPSWWTRRAQKYARRRVLRVLPDSFAYRPDWVDQLAAGTLPPFSGNTRACTACGSQGPYRTPSDTYHPATTLTPAFMRRECSHCDYEWLEAPAFAAAGRDGERNA